MGREEFRVAEASAYLRARVREPITVGLVLGSGWADFAESLHDGVEFSFAEIPHFPALSVEGHRPRLFVGHVGAATVACLAGRAHGYEGHDPADVVRPLRVLARLGMRVAILTNASGGIREDLCVGDLMLIADHLNATGANPLVGPETKFGHRFVDMVDAYDPTLRKLVRAATSRVGIELKEGVYAAVLGPMFETPAEVRALRALGADAVGMSTVWETIALRQLGVRVIGFSLITNRAAGLSTENLAHLDVLAVARRNVKIRHKLLSVTIESVVDSLGKEA